MIAIFSSSLCIPANTFPGSNERLSLPGEKHTTRSGLLTLSSFEESASQNLDGSPYAPFPGMPFTVTTFLGSTFTSTTMPKKGAIISSQV